MTPSSRLALYCRARIRATRRSAAHRCAPVRLGAAPGALPGDAAGASGKATSARLPAATSPCTTAGVTAAARASSARGRGAAPSAAASTRARWGVIRAGLRPVATTPRRGVGATSASRTLRAMRSTDPGVARV